MKSNTRANPIPIPIESVELSLFAFLAATLSLEFLFGQPLKLKHEDSHQEQIALYLLSSPLNQSHYFSLSLSLSLATTKEDDEK